MNKKNEEREEAPGAAKSRQKRAGRFLYSSFSKPADSRIQVKMPEHLRNHWVAAARGEKRSLSSVVIELLEKRYGLPDEEMHSPRPK